MSEFADLTQVTVEQAKASALVFGEAKDRVLLRPCTPSVALRAATELGFPHFSHLKNGYPVYSKHPREY